MVPQLSYSNRTGRYAVKSQEKTTHEKMMEIHKIVYHNCAPSPNGGLEAQEGGKPLTLRSSATAHSPATTPAAAHSRA